MTHTHKTYNAAVLQNSAHKTLQYQVVKILSDFDLSTAEWIILGYIFQNQSARFIDLALCLDVEPPHITTLVDVLEKKKLVERRDDPEDRRARRIVLTRKSLDLIPEVEIKLSTQMNRLLSGITPQEMVVYFKILDVIIKNGIELEASEKLSAQSEHSISINKKD